MRQLLKKAVSEEDGAVTVDWVVLTAGIVALNLVVLIGMIENGINQAASSIYEDIEAAVSFIP